MIFLVPPSAMEWSKELTCHWCSCGTFSGASGQRRMDKELTSSLDDGGPQHINGLFVSDVC